MSSWLALEQALAAWAAAGRVATFWWRDDDAGPWTESLEVLVDLAVRRNIPLALAVIPSKAEAGVEDRLAASGAEISVLQHGFAHRNHAPGDAKKCELVAPQRRPELLAELAEGGRRLKTLFGARALPIMVPPWNRIDPSLLAELAPLGLTGLSTYKARKQAEPLPGLRQVNCHLDIMRWYPLSERGFLGEDAALALLVDHLSARAEGAVDPEEPTGILSHHAAHDAAAWRFLDELLHRLAGHPAVAFLSAEAAFAGVTEPAAARIEAGGST